MTGLAPGVALPSSGFARAGFGNVSAGHVLEIPGPGAGWESEFSVSVSELLFSGFAAYLENQECQSPAVQG